MAVFLFRARSWLVRLGSEEWWLINLCIALLLRVALLVGLVA
jgi:hypothetical protein